MRIDDDGLTVQRARKDYLCGDCERIIEKGTEYRRVPSLPPWLVAREEKRHNAISIQPKFHMECSLERYIAKLEGRAR